MWVLLPADVIDLIQSSFFAYGASIYTRSDGVVQFAKREFKKFVNKKGFFCVISTIYAQSNGHAEISENKKDIQYVSSKSNIVADIVGCIIRITV